MCKTALGQITVVVMALTLVGDIASMPSRMNVEITAEMQQKLGRLEQML